MRNVFTKDNLAKYYVPLLIAVLALGTSVYIVRRSMSDGNLAKTTLVDCLGTELSADFKCWENRLQTLTREQSPTAAFEDIKLAYSGEPYVVAQCHQLVHRIGREAADRYGDIAESYKYGDNFCWSGYYHGVMEALTATLGKDYVINNIGTICSSLKKESPYSFYHFNCVHGLGHGVMGLTKIELFESLEICQKMTDAWEQESCYGGVFMENVMSEDNGDHGTKYLFKDQPMYPCTAVTNTFKNQCYLMQTSYALKLLNYDFSKVFELCSGIEQQFVSTCYQSIGRDASGNSSSDVNRTRETCLLGSGYSAQSNCVIGAVKDFISYYHGIDQANTLCDSFINLSLRDVCQTTAATYYKSF